MTAISTLKNRDSSLGELRCFFVHNSITLQYVVLGCLRCKVPLDVEENIDSWSIKILCLDIVIQAKICDSGSFFVV